MPFCALKLQLTKKIKRMVNLNFSGINFIFRDNVLAKLRNIGPDTYRGGRQGLCCLDFVSINIKLPF